MKYLLTISYDGSKYHGFQRQNNVKSIQGEIEKYLSKYLKEDIVIKGAGRTDRGVHACNQKAHFETDKSIKGLKSYLNNNLDYIRIKNIKKVDNDFHARFSVKEKIYLYKISYNRNIDSNYYLILYKNIDIHKMKEASKLFIGVHNFKNFCSGDKEEYITYIKSIRIYKYRDNIYIRFIGSGFYRYMVRNLVGALIEVGKGKVSIEELNSILNLTSSRRLSTSLPNGLYLKNIKY